MQFVAEKKTRKHFESNALLNRRNRALTNLTSCKMDSSIGGTCFFLFLAIFYLNLCRYVCDDNARHTQQLKKSLILCRKCMEKCYSCSASTSKLHTRKNNRFLRPPIELYVNFGLNNLNLFLHFIFKYKLCVILEPMQELMSRHKAYSLNPRDCLKTTLFQKWQRMVAPPGKRGTFLTCKFVFILSYLYLFLFHSVSWIISHFQDVF